MTREDIIRMAREAGAVPHAKDAFGDPTGFSVGVANFERFAALVAKHERERIAAELRRLYAENKDFRATCDHLTRENAGQIGEIVALKEQRDELLEALREMVAGDAEAIAEADALGIPFPEEMLTAYRRAVSAIAKAEGEKS